MLLIVLMIKQLLMVVQLHIECIAGGTPSDFNYEWMKNGVIISGETGSTLTISSVTISDIGEYKCTPSNSLGSTNSSSTILSVNGKIYLLHLL